MFRPARTNLPGTAKRRTWLSAAVLNALRISMAFVSNAVFLSSSCPALPCAGLSFCLVGDGPSPTGLKRPSSASVTAPALAYRFFQRFTGFGVPLGQGAPRRCRTTRLRKIVSQIVAPWLHDPFGQPLIQRFLDLAAWGHALQRIDERVHYVFRVTAGRGKDDI